MGSTFLSKIKDKKTEKLYVVKKLTGKLKLKFSKKQKKRLARVQGKIKIFCKIIKEIEQKMGGEKDVPETKVAQKKGGNKVAQTEKRKSFSLPETKVTVETLKRWTPYELALPYLEQLVAKKENPWYGL